MAKSRGRKFAELVAPSNGIFDAASLPTIPAGKLPTISLSKLANSTFSVNSESASLGGNVVLDSNDITEHSSALYFTNTRADARITAHNLLARAGGTMTGNLTLGDNVNAYFGASTDLRIYHDGTNSHIINSTGELRFTGSNFAFKSDSAKLYFGASDDLQIYHDGSHSYMANTGGSLYIRSANSIQLETNGGVDMLTLGVGGAATLYHNGSAKFATTSTGVQTTGTVNVNGAYTLPTSDGTAGQVLQTDGSGNLTFATGGGSGDITAVVAGTNLTGGATSGSATVNLAGSLTSISKITFTSSNIQAPTSSDATTGARLVLYSNGSGRDYSIGIESDTMWFNSDNNYKWYADGTLKFEWDNSAGQLEIGGNKVWHAGNDGASSGLDADTVDGIQALSFLRSDTNDSVGTDVRHDYGPNSTWSSTLRVGGNGYSAANSNAIASVVTTNGNLHLDSGGNKGMYLNHYSGTAGVAFGSGASGAVAWMGSDGDLWKGNADNTGSKYWHAGNDGAGSGLDADLLDGLHSTDLARVGNVSSTFGGTPGSGNLVRFENASGQSMNSASSYLSRLECFQPSVNADAFMSFHIGSDYAFYFGIDGATNDLSIGGWSMGANKYKVWHAANDGAGSGLDADLLDGQQGSYYYAASNPSGYLPKNSNTMTGSGFKLGFHSGAGGTTFNANHYSMGVDVANGSWSGTNYSDLIIGYHTGIRIGAGYSGIRFYDNSPTTDTNNSGNGNGGEELLMTIGGGGSASSGSNVTVHNSLTVSGTATATTFVGALTGTATNADTVDNLHASNFLRSDASDTFGSTSSNQTINYYCNSGQYIASAGSSTRFPIQIYGPTANGGDAALIFHIGSDYAGFFGLAADINDLAWGGWSVGSTTKHRIWHQGNDGSGSGLDADLLDGQHASSFMASTGMSTSADTYINARVIRNSGSSAGSDGMYIGYGNAGGSSATRIYGGGSTSANMSVTNTNVSLTGLDLNVAVMTATSTANFNSTVVQQDGQVFRQEGYFTTNTSGQNTNSSVGAYSFGFQMSGGWSHPYPDLCVGYHTGVRIGGHKNYLGTRFYNDHPLGSSPTEIFSIGKSDDHIRATSNIYAYTSDKRLKENFRIIENAVDKVKSLGGYIFDWREDMMAKYEFEPDQTKDDAGVIAQDVLKVMPAAVQRAPFDYDPNKKGHSKSGEEFMTVQYEKMVPLLIEAIKEQQEQIDQLKKLLEEKE